MNVCTCLQWKCNRSLLLIHKMTLHEQRVIQALITLLREGLVRQPFKCHSYNCSEENNLVSAPGNDALVPKIHSQHLSLFCSSWGNIFGCCTMWCWILLWKWLSSLCVFYLHIAACCGPLLIENCCFGFMVCGYDYWQPVTFIVLTVGGFTQFVFC